MPANMARRVLLFTLFQRCLSVDPLQPPGGTFHWGNNQPAFSWSAQTQQQPQPAPPAQPAAPAPAPTNVLLPNPPAQPQGPPQSPQLSFWNSGSQGQAAQGQVHHSPINFGGPGHAAHHPQVHISHETHVHVDHGGQGGPHMPSMPQFPSLATPLPAGQETVDWMITTAQATTTPDPFELPQPDVPQFQVETDIPDGSPLASCKGYEEHWAQCTQPSCDGAAERVNCAWTVWTEWESLGGCSGLGLRSRKIARHHANGGRPCTGIKEETKEMDQFFGEGCLLGDRDCEWGEWSDWSHCGCEICGEDRNAQKVKYRKIVKQALGDGAPCSGNFNVTEPCAATEKPQDCRLSDWAEWTRCSASCNGGVRASMRRVMREADFGGDACDASLRRTESCGTLSCEHHADCVLGQWGSWRGCDIPGTVQMTRQRQIETYAKGDGKPCDAPLTETSGCSNRDNTQWCDISGWSSWSTCPVACGGGQQMRVRHLRSQTNCFPMAREDLKEIRGCNTDSCNYNGGCEMSSWSAWGECSQDCGVGVSVRTRNIDKAAENGGKSCMASLKEMKDCMNEPCPIRDCLWAAWDHWSGCSCTCGGGLKRRARIIQVAPRAGGALCEPSDKLQVVPCNTHPCGDCVDGKWTSWSMWSECTATCAPAYRWRHRSVAERNNDCGSPVTGLEEDYELCSSLDNCTRDQDCVLSDWEDWNGCSCSCYGVTERHRHVKLLPVGKGKRCQEQSLKEIAPCNPAMDEERPSGCRNQGPENCTFSRWEPWSTCSKPCGGGDRTRMRSIKSPLNHNGFPCEGELAEISPCNTFHCPENHCVDCKWGAWSEWGDCSACSGQKYRQRIIAHLQNDCGHKCDPGGAKETMNCTGFCDDEVYCRWSDWKDLGSCTATCGTSVRVVQRRLEITNVVPTPDDYNETLGGNYLFAGTSDMVCSGEQTKTVECDSVDCDEGCYPRHCLFGAWNEWSEPSCTQLCNRDRVIAQRSECGGQPCAGPQTETKVCPRESCVEEVDCTISEWDQWSYCSKDTPGSNRVRARSILAQAQNGGKACGTRYPQPPLSLEEIEPCENWKKDSSVTDCMLTTWGSWTECTALCNGGLKHRNRGVRTPPTAGGVPCQGSLEELVPCNLGKCQDQKERDCKFSPWTEWSHCDSHDQRERYRLIAVEPLMDGKPCNGTLKEIRPCTIAVDCVISPWTPWDQCDKSCDGGQKQRQRQVELNPKHGGKPCPLGLIETEGCNREPCDDKEVNCKASSWSVWSRCSASCGPGVKERQRTVTNRLSNCGAGCVGNLSQVEPCYLEHCGGCDPCHWGEWRDWSDCDVHCGGGQRVRLRNITTWPSPGCPPCEAMSKEELGACNLDPCPDSELCVDGQWASWNDWEACSTSCEGGMRWRVRHVGMQATSCGREPSGDSREEEECNKGVPCKASQDCELSPWSVWSDCSASCHGIKKRERSVTQHGYGAGRYCEGILEEAFPCALGISRSLEDWSSEHLYLNLKNVYSNNLGGQGPDFQVEQALRFKNAAADNAQSVDLLVTVAEESDYRVNKAGVINNGLAGEFGNIFVGRDSDVVLDFQLVDSQTNDPMAPEDFVIKFYDSDSGLEGSDVSTYSITAVDECEEFYNTPDSVFKVKGSCAEPGLTEFEKPFISDPGCDAGGFEVMDLGRVINSNLMGKGPDLQGKPELHFENVLNVDGSPVDLVIEVVTGEYEPGDPQANGKFGGRTQYNQGAAMGAINVATGTRTKFKASFKRSDGFAVYVPKLNFTFWDIDMPLENLRERVAVFGYKDYYTTDAHGSATQGNSVAFMHQSGGGEFSSGRLNVPEPMDPLHPTADQRDVAVTFFFENVAMFFFELEVTWIGQSTEESDAHKAQLFFFSGTACSGQLPNGYMGYESRRLQVFNVPWLPQDPVTNVVHQVQNQVQQQAHQVTGNNVVHQVQNALKETLPMQPKTQKPAYDAHKQRAEELQNQEVTVFKESSPSGICPEFPRPVADWSPLNPMPQKEKEAIAIRFERQSRVRLRLKTGKEGCGHNFMFAVKACLSGHCDPCAIGSTCVFKSWEQWGSCTEACEGGVEERKRGVTQGAASSHGSGCDGALVSVRSCNTQSCSQNCQPVNCKWAKWGQWSACSKCAGQKTRSRRVARTPECGGRRCEAGDAEEIAKCPRNCLGEPICEWSDWSSFSPCSVSCGCGRKKRTRRLQKVIHTPRQLTAAYEKLERLDGHVQNLESKRWKVRVLSFLAGPSLMLMAFAMIRAWSRRPQVMEDPLPDPEQAGLVELVAEDPNRSHLRVDPL